MYAFKFNRAPSQWGISKYVNMYRVDHQWENAYIQVAWWSDPKCWRTHLHGKPWETNIGLEECNIFQAFIHI